MTDTPHEDEIRPRSGVGTDTHPAAAPAAPAPGTPASSPGQPARSDAETDAQPRTRDVAAEEAAGVAHDAKDAAVDVAQTAKDEASAVAGEAKDQARRMYEETRHELAAQASTQQSRAASGLSALGTELRQMADRSDGGPAADLARQGAERADAAAAWLGDREPGDVVDDLSRWARKRPGTFLAAAAAVGVLAGRLTRGLADDAREDGEDARAEGRPRSSARAVPSRYSSADHPLASDDLPPAVEPDESFVAGHAPVADRGRE